MLHKNQHRSFGDLKPPSRGKDLMSFMVAQHFCNTRNKELPSSSIVCFTMIWFDFQADLREFISSNACQIHNSTSISQTAVNAHSILHSSMKYSILIGLSVLLYQVTDFLHAVSVLYFSYYYAVCFCSYNKCLIFIRQISMWKVEQCTVRESLQSHTRSLCFTSGSNHSVRVYFMTIYCPVTQWFSNGFSLKPRHYIQNDLACKDKQIKNKFN